MPVHGLLDSQHLIACVHHMTLPYLRQPGWWCVQIEDYERSADDDERFGIDHLKAQEQAESQAEGSKEAGCTAPVGAIV